MEILRRFVPAGTDPFSMFEYEKYDCVMTDFTTKKVTFEQKGCEVPKNWSVLARNILITKYFRKAGVPSKFQCDWAGDIPPWLRPVKAGNGASFGGETSVRQAIGRLAGHWTYFGYINGYFSPSEKQLATKDEGLIEQNAKAFYDEIVYMLLNQMAAPNSPQWFNTGLWWAYGIEGKGQGHFYVDRISNTKGFKAVSEAADEVKRSFGDMHQFGVLDTKKTMSIENHNRHIRSDLRESSTAYKMVQAHACFILTLNDSMCGKAGILDFYKNEGRIFKYGSGSGTNASNLRGRVEKLSGGGTSSGVMSWLKVADYGAGAIKSGGTTRRAAKMVVLDVDHPDIYDFINCKVTAETTVSAMVTGAKIVNDHCQGIIDSVSAGLSKTEIGSSDVIESKMEAARLAGVAENHIQQAMDLAKQGIKKWGGINWTSRFQGETSAYEVVPFQNTNHSVRIPYSFYEAVDKGLKWPLHHRTNPADGTLVDSSQLEHDIATAAWRCGDPGLHFKDNINDWHVCKNDGEIRASNPCSEYFFLDDTACNLASIRVTKFVDETGFIDAPMFRHAARIWTIVLDITNSMAHMPNPEVALGTFNYRTIGLGYCDLGAMIMGMGIPYDDDAARAVAGAVTAIMDSESNLTSAFLAKNLGAYPRYWANKEHHQRVLKNHLAIFTHKRPEKLNVDPPSFDINILEKVVGSEVAAHVFESVVKSYSKAIDMSFETGLRNAQNTLLAPTGTIGLLMDCSTTGVEPVIGLASFKEMIGGSGTTMVPVSVQDALVRLKYSNPRAIVEHVTSHGGHLPAEGHQFQIRPEHRKVFQTALSNDPNNPAIRWEAHVNMMAAVQPFLSGAISKTINMPVESTVDDIKLAYRMAHDLGLKSLAVYRDNCKLSQPVSLSKVKKTAPAKVEETSQKLAAVFEEMFGSVTKPIPETPVFSGPKLVMQRNKLPSIRHPGMDVAVEVGSGHLYVKTSRYDDDRCGEIWISYSADQGIIQALLSQICKTANVALQYGVPLRALVRSWKDSYFEPAGLVGGHPNVKFAKSLINLAARLLQLHELNDDSDVDVHTLPEVAVEAKVIPPVKVQRSSSEPDNPCSNCGGIDFQVTGTCKTCKRCGNGGGCG